MLTREAGEDFLHAQRWLGRVAPGSISANAPSNTEVTMKNESLLDHVRVASPCNARWEDMAGDDRARFCKQCSKHVFNLSAMSQAEAETLVRNMEGKFCGRFHQRRDGRMLTSNCPVGRQRGRSRLLKSCAAGFAAITILATALAAGGGQRRDNATRGPLARKIDGWIYDAKVKLGIIQPQMLLGEIMVVPPPAPKSSSNSSGK